MDESLLDAHIVETDTPSQNGEQHGGRLSLILGLGVVLVLAACWVYRGASHAPFLFDDIRCIVDNRTLTSLWPPEVPSGLERRPIGRLSLALSYALGGTEVRGYHAFNLAVHVASGLILFGLVRRTLRLDPLRAVYGTAGPYLAFAVALVWLVHPLATQAVIYIVQRLESMMALFFLACLYSVLRGSQSSRSGRWYAAAVAAFWLGMGTKEVMVAAALVVPLYDRVFLSESWAGVFRRRWPVYLGFLPALAAMFLALTPWFVPSGPSASGFGYEHISPLEYLATQPGVILHYLRLSFWPDGLCLDYGWPVARSAGEILVPGAAIVGLLSASVVLLRFRPRIGFLAVSVFLVLAPTSSIMPLADPAFEHRMYLPLAALVAMAVMSSYHAWELATRESVGKHWRWVVPAAVLVLVAGAHGHRSVERTKDYRTELSIWTDTVVKRPYNPRAYYNRGIAYSNLGDEQRAIDSFSMAVELAPDHAVYRANRGVAVGRMGQYDLAIKDLTHAIKLDPKLPEAYHNRATAYLYLGQYKDAIEDLNQAIDLDPNFAEAYSSRGTYYYLTGNYAEARRDVETVRKLGAEPPADLVEALGKAPDGTE